MDKEKTLLDPDCRVLDLCMGRGHLCGKILAALGADVIQVERPQGDPARNIGPFYKDIPDPEKSLWWFAYNMNKRGITLDIESSDGRKILRELVEKADFVIESFEPGYMEELGLGYRALEKINPRVIMVSISGFGQTGPYAHYKAPDIVLMSLGGQAFMAGDSDRPPVQVSYPHAWHFAALHGATGAMNAFYWRGLTGEGQHVDASGQTGIIWTNMNANVTWDIDKMNTKRGGATFLREVKRPDGTIHTLLTKTTFPCKDGYVYLRLMGGTAHGHMIYKLVKWMDDEGMASEWLKNYDFVNDFDYANMSQDVLDRAYEEIEPFLMRHGMLELYEEALRRGHNLVPIGTPKSICEDKQLAFREFWTEIDHPELQDTLTYPGWPVKQSETTWRLERRAPLIGEHNEEIYKGELGFSNEKLVLLKSAGVI